jgi:hypothetical protein
LGLIPDGRPKLIPELRLYLYLEQMPSLSFDTSSNLLSDLLPDVVPNLLASLLPNLLFGL